MTEMFERNGLIALADHCQAISLFSDEQAMRTPTFKIPLLMILNTPRCIKVAKGGAVNYCTCCGNGSYKG